AAASAQAAPSPALNKEAPARAPTRGLARVLTVVHRTLSLGRTASLFEGSRVGAAVGFRPDEGSPNRVDGVDLDPVPTAPQRTNVPGVSWDNVQLPGHPSRPTFLARVFGRRSVAPIELPGAPRDAADVESALRRLIQDNPGDFGGVSAAQLATVMAHKVSGAGGLTDAVYVNFKQVQNGVAVEGTYLGFTVKLIGGKAVVVASSAQLFPQLAVDTFGRLDDRQIVAKAAERLGQATASAEDFLDQGVRVMYLEGKWRAVRLMLSKAKTLMAAVDINSGETFAWDPRHKLEDSGTAVGRGIADGPIGYSDPSPLALAHVAVTASNGKTYYADADGKFKVEGEGDAPVTLTVRLSGRYAYVEDQENKDLVVTVTAKP
ncbi:MAG: hypothetical protein KGL53_02035, partial [Elusimicrobia bacterium]|nr:hypothetical protein [Elusimicrobiota bacterium]